MGQPNIKLARIDNRLVHGQVGNQWTGASGANLIVVADDECASDDVMKQVMKMTADSSGVGIRFFTVQKTIDVIAKASPRQLIFLVCKNPANMRKLIEGGVPIKEVNIGNMHMTAGKETYKDAHVYVDKQDLDDFEAMKKLGAKLYIQMAPGSKRIDL